MPNKKTKKEYSARDYKKEFMDNKMYYIDRNIRWQDTYYVIDKDEIVLLQCRYKIVDREFHLYLIEKDGKKYCKLINLEKLYGDSFPNSESDCYDFFKGHVSYCNTFEISIFLPNYRKRLVDNTEIIKLDRRIDELLDSASNIDFKEAYMDLFKCGFYYSFINFDCYDFYNKHVFIADGFCLKKYEPYINILNYIFSKSNYNELSPSSIEVVESLDIAYKKIIELDEERSDLIF